MSERDIPVTEDELHAYADNQLPAERRQTVEDWLAAHPDDAERVNAWRVIAEQVREHYAGVVDEPVPRRLDLDRIDVRRPRRLMLGAVAAALLAFVMGGSAGWVAHTALATEMTTSEALRDDAVVAHKLYTREQRHPIEVASNEDHLMPWLSRRVGTTLHAPDLTRFGFRLLGGRLLPGPSAPAALFMFENDTGDRITLYCTPVKAPTEELTYKMEDGAGSVLWTHDDFGWVISGPPNKELLKSVAAEAYAQLETW